MIYTIHGPSRDFAANTGQPTELQFSNLVAVPENLAKWALIAPPFWLAYHRLWWWFGAYGLFLIAMTGLLATSFWLIAVCLAGLPGLYLLLEGRQLYRTRLQESGLDMVGLVDATSEDGAVARYVEQVVGQPKIQTTGQHSRIEENRTWRAGSPQTTNTPSIGLFPVKDD